MIDDPALLQRYADEKSEAAFAELVRRHVDLVYGVALRQCGGDASLAQDVTQIVFTALARKAGPLAHRPVLGGWLYRTTQYAAVDAVRAEARRRRREQEAHIMTELSRADAHDEAWHQIRPELDRAMSALQDADRDALVLRFFEGRSFAEVGARLRLTENAARMRVERALEKLHRLLSGRGVTSTSAALGLALSSRAAVSAPPGLAASVTGGALAGAAAAGVATGLGALLGFMSTSKLSTGALVALIALGLSVAGNAYLLTHPAASVVEAQSRVAIRDIAHAKPETLAELAKGDVRVLAARLRAGGTSEATVRGMVEGVLRRRYREVLAARQAELSRHAWWSLSKGSAPDTSFRPSDDPRLLREMVLDPLQQLFGPDPVEQALSEARYAFLPEHKRAAFIALDREFQEALARIPGADARNAQGEVPRRDRDEKEKRLLAELTSAERAEYDLRLSPTAIGIRERMAQFGATESEYRALMPILLRPENAAANRITDPNPAAREQRMADEVVATLGYDRALDYIWAGAWQYPSYARVAREAGLPPSTPARVLELASETIQRTVAIRQNPALSPEEKRAAALALQAEVRPRLDQLLPPAQRQRLSDDGNRLTGDMWMWFDGLAQARSAFIATTVTGTTGGVVAVGSFAVDDAAPLQGNAASRQLVVRRPAAP